MQFSIQTLLKRYMESDASPAFLPYSRVEIVVNDKLTYAAGDPSGRTLTIRNEWGTQEQANNILSKIKGFVYQPYSTTGALLNPAAELGDGVSMNESLYSGIYKLSKDYSSLMASDIEAPEDEEIDHEYPFEPKAERQTQRTFSAMESTLRIQTREIEAKVSKESPEGQTSFSWSLQDNSWEVKSNGNTVFKVTSTGAEVTGTIKATGGTIGGFTINENEISYNGLTWGGTKTGIYLGTSGLQLGSKNGAYFQASRSGSVIAHNMTLTGTLYFKDGNGQTQSMNANQLRAGAQSAYTYGGTWSGTSTAWANATKNNATSYPAYFRCGAFTATSIGTDRLTIPYGSQVFLFAGQWITLQTRTINGTTIHFLGY